MGCNPEKGSPFLPVPPGLEFTVTDVPDEDHLRRGFVGVRMIVRTMVEGMVFGEDSPHMAFGHEHITLHHTPDRNRGQ